VLALDANSAAALNNLAYLCSERFQELDRARDLAQRAHDLLPQEPRPADTLGWILYRRHEYAKAVSLLQDSAGKLAADAEIQFHLGMAQYRLGAEEPARRALRQALQAPAGFPGVEEARLRLSILEIDSANVGAAERILLDKTAAGDPDDPVVLVRLAAVYAREGKAEKARHGLRDGAKRESHQCRGADGSGPSLCGPGRFGQGFRVREGRAQSGAGRSGGEPGSGRPRLRGGRFSLAASLLEGVSRSRPNDPRCGLTSPMRNTASGGFPKRITPCARPCRRAHRLPAPRRPAASWNLSRSPRIPRKRPARWT